MKCLHSQGALHPHSVLSTSVLSARGPIQPRWSWLVGRSEGHCEALPDRGPGSSVSAAPRVGFVLLTAPQFPVGGLCGAELAQHRLRGGSRYVSVSISVETGRVGRELGRTALLSQRSLFWTHRKTPPWLGWGADGSHAPCWGPTLPRRTGGELKRRCVADTATRLRGVCSTHGPASHWSSPRRPRLPHTDSGCSRP